MNLFKKIAADLGVLSDEALTAALEEHIAAVKKARADYRAQDETLLASIPGETPEEQGAAFVEALTAAVADIDRMREALAARTAGSEVLDAKVDEITASIPDDDEAETEEVAETDEVTAEAEADVVAEAEAVTAEAADAPAETTAATAEAVVASVPPVRLRAPRRSAEHDPATVAGTDTTGVALTASAGLENHREGMVLDRIELAKAVIDKRRRAVSTAPGIREEIIVASARWELPEARVLRENAYEQNTEKIQAVTSEDAIVASGGLCAPVSNYYELANVSVPDRPVRDALAGFQAVRGGIKFGRPPVLGDVTSAISLITADEDGQGGTFATKSCQIVDCPTLEEVDLDIVAHCVQFGNLGSRAWPEQVAQFNDLVMAAHARVAEVNLLDGIGSASTQVTATDTGFGYMGVSGLLGQILAAAAGMRSRNRMADGVRLRWFAPAWIKQWLVADLVNSQFDRFSRDEAGVVAMLRELGGIEPSFTLDGETGQGQIFGAQAAGALLTFPSTITHYLFPEGSFLFLDGGELELGIVRDSVLNSTNDYQIFGETFENVAFVGVESLRITSTLCPAGATGGPAASLLC